jgi:hypothetical protein
MNENRFQIVLIDDGIELGFDQGDIFPEFIRSPIGVVGLDIRAAGRYQAVDCHTDIKVIFVGVLERLRFLLGTAG